MKNYTKIFKNYISINLQSTMEYKKSFLLQFFGMLLNNGSFIFFWIILFETFQETFETRNIQLQDVMTLWAICTSAFGFTHIFLAGSRKLSQIIYTGQLDTYLLFPKSPLFTITVSKSVTSAWGDLIYGFILYFLFIPKTITSFLLFCYFTITSGIFLSCFFIIINSLSFFIGNSEQIQGMLSNGLISFSTYPQNIFSPTVKFFLFSVIPVAYFAYLPVEVLLNFSFLQFIYINISVIISIIISKILFNLGCKKYESGNLFYINE